MRIIWGIFFLCLMSLRVDAAVLVGTEMPVPLERFINCFGEEAQKRFHLELVSMSTHDDLCSNVIDLLFDYYGELTVAKARELITNVTDAFLIESQNESSLERCLNRFPLTLKDLTVRIRHRKMTCGFVYPKLENVEGVLLQDGKIYYQTINASRYTIEVLRIESYENALQIIGFQPSEQERLNELIDNHVK